MSTKDSRTPYQAGKTALVLAGRGIAGFLYERAALTALEATAGSAVSNDFDVYEPDLI
jgi:hypothetical protein